MMNAIAASTSRSLAPVAPATRAPTRATVVASAHKVRPADKKRGVVSIGLAMAAAVSLNLAPAAHANVKYANDCDPICHVLDDGAAKSAKMEKDMKEAGPDMGSLLEKLAAERKATEAAEKAKK